jgi:hypothetical protein
MVRAVIGIGGDGMKKIALASLGWVLLTALPCAAQVRTRWRLDFSHEKPRMFTYRNALGEYENYWYAVYTVKNPTSTIVPLHVEVAFYGAAGLDYLHDVGKVDLIAFKAALAVEQADPDALRRVLAGPKADTEAGRGQLRDGLKALMEIDGPVLDAVTAAVRFNPESLAFILTPESFARGQYVRDTLVPEEVEAAIIEADAKLGRRSPGVVLDSIRAFKKAKQYLNKKELREQRVIRPAEEMRAIAIFRGVDPRHTWLTLQVSGLVDFVKIARFDPQRGPIFEYENLMRWTRYRFPGDEFDRENDVLTKADEGWEPRRIGPPTSKESLGSMIDEMVAELRRHKAIAAAGQTPPPRVVVSADDMDRIVMLLNVAVGERFRFEKGKSVLENEANVWAVHEWWTTNRSKLAYDRTRNRFVVNAEPLPGTTDVLDR